MDQTSSKKANEGKHFANGGGPQNKRAKGVVGTRIKKGGAQGVGESGKNGLTQEEVGSGGLLKDWAIVEKGEET